MDHDDRIELNMPNEDASCKYSFEKIIVDVMPIRAGNQTGMLFPSRLGSVNKGKCILHKEKWYTPRQFEIEGGLKPSKDWRRSIKCADGRKLVDLILSGELRPHFPRCRCSVCTGDSE